MSFSYKIDPALNLIYYKGTKLCTGAELLKLERDAFQDPLRRPRMKIIVDVQFAELDTDLLDMRNLMARNKQLLREGHELEMTAVITNNKFFQTLGNVLQMLDEEIPLKLGIFHTLQDAIRWLGLYEAKEQIIQIRDVLQEGHEGSG
jgi:hypothetical protein